MTLTQKLIRFSLAAALLGSLSACVVAPAQPGAYRGPAVYVETYPTYRNTYPNTYYDGWYGNRYYDNRGGRYYRDERRHEEHRHDERRYEEPRRIESPLDSAARTHRDIRRSLGLPRLPGMP